MPRLKLRMPKALDGVMGEPFALIVSLMADGFLPMPPLKGRFLFLTLVWVFNFFGLPMGERALPSRLLTSFSSGRKLGFALDCVMLALFCRLLLRTWSRFMFFLTRTSGICCEKRDDISANELPWLPTL